MTNIELENLRISDIDFFARKYSRLFHESFEKDEESFYHEIKNELNKKCSQYVIKDNLIGAAAISRNGIIEFNKKYFNPSNLEMRIHELFHSYNNFKTDKNYKAGLRNFDTGLILSQIDEGTTEMFAQMICGNEHEEAACYNGEVEFSRYLMAIVGKDVMIKSTRGNPEILSSIVDALFGTKDFLTYLDDFQMKKNCLVEKAYQDNIDRTKNIDATLSKIQLSELYGSSMVSLLWEKCTNNPGIYNRLIQAEKYYKYNTSMELWVNSVKEFHETEILSDKIKQYLLEDISKTGNQIDMLDNELNKYLYDLFTFQKHFLGRKEPEYSMYVLTSDDKKYANNFQSDIDGSHTRIGGSFGITGPYKDITSDINTCFRVTEDYLKSIYISTLDYTELEGKHIDYWAKKVIIDLKESIISSWYYWIKSNLFNDYDEVEYYELIEKYKEYLIQKENSIIEEIKNTQR